MTVAPGTVLWTPPPDARRTSRLGRFLAAVEERTGRRFDTYEDAWRWSVESLADFWAAVWEFGGIVAHRPYETVLERRTMPGARWFTGATLNYAEHALRWPPGDVRIRARGQTRPPRDLTGAELSTMVGRIQDGLRRAGVGRGDHVVGYLPNVPEAVAAHLAAAGLGAIWCSVPPEMGPRAVLDRVAQLDPAVLLCVDGYRWGAREISRRDAVAEVRRGLRALTVELPYLGLSPVGDVLSWAEFTAVDAAPVFDPVPFDHPLVVLFSSGTTGLPKAILHSHGGLLLEHVKALGLQMDLGPGSTAFWYTTTGWMVWNLVVSALAVGAGVVLFDGDPAWPALDAAWGVVAETGADFFGTSAGYLSACARAGLAPGREHDLRALRQITSSGSPLSATAAAWVYEAVADDLLLASTSGGTDVCSGFLGGSPLTPVYAGEMSCRPLGVATDSYDEAGRPVRGVPGELVVTLPMPSMPVGFHGDADGSRYRAAYFATYPGVWRHGDWLVRTPRDTWVITGRSDATLNRGGVRLGTAEFYAVLDALPGVTDSLVIHLEDPGPASSGLTSAGSEATGATREDAASKAPGPARAERAHLAERGALIVALSGTADAGAVRAALRSRLSPRHSPDLVVVVDRLARNANGKRLEVPTKRVLAGTPVERAVELGGLADPDAFLSTVDSIRSALRGG